MYCLTMSTKTWKKLEPVLTNGPNLLEADKLCSWTYMDKIFIFGGYGNPPDFNVRLPKPSTFVLDEENYLRGWTNQLGKIIWRLIKH